MQTNFLGPLYTMQAALPAMRAARRGTIVNVSSVAARDPLPTCTLYSASKGALEGMSEALGREVSGFGIWVLVVEPGAFRTNFIAAMRDASADGGGEAMPADYRGTETEDTLRRLEAYHGRQRGDPAKGVERIFEAVVGEGMAGPLRGKVGRLVIGEDALLRINKANEAFEGELKLQQEIARSTDF